MVFFNCGVTTQTMRTNANQKQTCWIFTQVYILFILSDSYKIYFKKIKNPLYFWELVSSYSNYYLPNTERTMAEKGSKIILKVK